MPKRWRMRSIQSDVCKAELNCGRPWIVTRTCGEVMRRRPIDPRIGSKLPQILVAAGFATGGVHVATSPG
jgi:hypothetical protein